MHYLRHLLQQLPHVKNAPNTSSSIVSKSIAKGGGSTDYRGSVKFSKKSDGSKAHVECDTIIMDDMSSSDTIPTNAIENSNVAMEHEATIELEVLGAL